MKTRTGRPRGLTRLARALGLDRNPLRRATDRAEAWIRAGLLAVFVIAGPITASAAGHWAYHAGIAAARAPAAAAYRVKPVIPRPTLASTDLARGSQGGRAAGQREGAGPSARTGGVLAAVTTLAAMALALLAIFWLALRFLTRRRLAAWETAWSRIGPQWSRRRP